MNLKRKTKALFWICAVILVACMAWFSVSCSKPDDSENTTEAPVVKTAVKPNVIFILVDTLRADFVGAYGAKHPTPVFDMLAKKGVTFNKAIAPSSWTVPSIASIFTGMYPQKHGLTDGVAIHVQVFKQQGMPDEYETLAESFKKAGYTTFCATANSHLASKYGYDAGFDHFKMFKFQTGDAIEQTVKEWKPLLENASKETGYFLFLHWVDPHHPYEPQEPYLSNINPNYLKDAGKVLSDTGPPVLYEQGYFKEYPKALGVMKDIYNSEVLWTDASVGRVLADLPGVGDSMVVLTSDHGEAFAEHASMLHGYDLFQETVHVPLVIIWPDKKGAGTKVDTPVSLVDLPPTLLRFVNVKPPDEYEGIDLTPLVEGKQPPPRLIWSHLDKNGDYRWYTVFEDNLKFKLNIPITKTKKQKKAGKPRRYLFDLANDPYERKNLTKTKSQDALRLDALLKNEMKKPPLVEPETIKTDVEQGLADTFRSHGYL